MSLAVPYDSCALNACVPLRTLLSEAHLEFHLQQFCQLADALPHPFPAYLPRPGANGFSMSDSGEVEVESPSGAYQVLPKEVIAEIGSRKLFIKWSYEDIEIRDISLTYVFFALLIPRVLEGLIWTFEEVEGHRRW